MTLMSLLMLLPSWPDACWSWRSHAHGLMSWCTIPQFHTSLLEIPDPPNWVTHMISKNSENLLQRRIKSFVDKLGKCQKEILAEIGVDLSGQHAKKSLCFQELILVNCLP